MSQQTPELDKNKMNKWRQALKKKGLNAWNPPPPPPPVMVTQPTPNYSQQNPVDLGKAFEKLFQSDPNQIVKRDNDIWSITFPKVAEDLIELHEFKRNVVTAVLMFVKINFPLDVELAKDVRFKAGGVHVETSDYNHYPTITFKPEISGPMSCVDEFLTPIRQWSGCGLYWKGSFLKSKSTGKITGMRLAGLAYNVPDKFSHGQPISYVEKTVI